MAGKTVFHPGLLFMATPGNLYIYALQSNERPNAATALYRAPYFNLYNHGHMCRGNVRLPETLSIEDLNIWEEAFFCTEFTHTNLNGAELTLHPEGHDGLWKAQAKRNVTTFPGEHLAPLTLTVKEVINQ